MSSSIRKKVPKKKYSMSRLKSANPDSSKGIFELNHKNLLPVNKKHSRLSLGSKLSNFKSRDLINKVKNSQGSKASKESRKSSINIDKLMMKISNIGPHQINIPSLVKVLPPIISMKNLKLKTDEAILTSISALKADMTREYSELVTAKVQELQNDFMCRLDSQTETFELKLDSFKNKTTAMLKDQAEEISALHENFLGIQTEFMGRATRDKTELTNKLNKIHDRHQVLDKKFDQNDGVWQSLSLYMQTFIKILKIKSTLDYQDEEDRNSIALWGHQERKVRPTRDYSK